MRELRNLCIVSLIACLLLAGCGGEEPSPVYTQPTEENREVQDLGTLTILFTGDIQNVFAGNEAWGQIGYAALTAYRDGLEDEGETVVLVDGGNAISDEGAGAVKDGKTLAQLIGSAGYDFRVPGEAEFSYGMEDFLALTDEMPDCTYTSCNLVDAAGAMVMEPYVIVECGGIKVGFVGITSPHAADTLEDGDYGFCQGSGKDDFFGTVQDAIDAASQAGAEYIIAVGNLGTDPMDSPWTSAEVIANTTGLSVFLDCGGGVLEGETVKDLDNYEIPVCSPGSEFAYVGRITLNLNDGSANIELLKELEDEDSRIAKSAADLAEALE